MREPTMKTISDNLLRHAVSRLIRALQRSTAVAGHADSDVPDAGPAVEPGAERAERVEGTIVRGRGTPSEADSTTQELEALVEHVGWIPYSSRGRVAQSITPRRDPATT